MTFNISPDKNAYFAQSQNLSVSNNLGSASAPLQVSQPKAVIADIYLLQENDNPYKHRKVCAEASNVCYGFFPQNSGPGLVTVEHSYDPERINNKKDKILDVIRTSSTDEEYRILRHFNQSAVPEWEGKNYNPVLQNCYHFADYLMREGREVINAPRPITGY
jgi:hypothetical protein